MAVELCVTIGESLPGAVRKKVPKAISDLCLVCLKMMAEIDEVRYQDFCYFRQFAN